MLQNNVSSVFQDGIEKPRLKNSAIPIINGNGINRERSPPPRLERITEGSIPIGRIADRVIRRSYGEFLNLAETLPSMSDVPKKKKILESFLETRRQMIKLLVLVKWAKVSKEVDQCIDVVNFLHGQRIHFNDVIFHLQQVRHQLTYARVRNPDLRTAIDVLSTGDYPKFPNQVTSQFMPEPPVPLKKGLAALKSLNTLLHLRLTLHEILPLPLSNYIIANGKVTFVVPNEWQLTISITEEFGQWWFVDFKDHNGDEVGESIKARVQKILEEVFEQCKIEYGLFPMGVTEEALRSVNKKAPLVEVYNILHRFHLMYSLSKLHRSLYRLSSTPRFSPYIQVLPNREAVVEFQYWIRTPAIRSQTTRSHLVRLFIVNEETDSALDEAIYAVPGGHTALDYERTKIGVQWMRDGVEIGDQELSEVDLSNAEKLVEHVTKIHAQTILERIASESEGLTFWEDEELYFRLIDSDRQIRISVDLLTGRVLLTEVSKTSAVFLPQLLQVAQTNLYQAFLPPVQPLPGQQIRRPPTIKESISSARLSILKSHVLALAEYKGWTSQRYEYGYVSRADLSTFLPQQWTGDDLLFLSLGKENIVINLLSKQGWLVDLRSLGDGGNLRVVWVEKIADVASTDGKVNWLCWLDAIRFYARGRYAIYEFEQGLERRHVQHSVIQPPSRKEASVLSNQMLLPLLSLKSKNLIPEHSSCWASENIILRVVRAGNHIVAVWEGKVRYSSEVEQLLSSVIASDPLTYNSTRKTFHLKFPLSEESTPDVIVGHLINRFLSIERILQLVRQAKAVQRSSEDNVFHLERFNLGGLEFVYGVDGPDGELWPVQLLVRDRCDIIFRPDDPHVPFKAFITDWYNTNGGGISVLADYLQATLPMYKELMVLEATDPEHPNSETLYDVFVLPKSVTSVQLYSPQGPYMLGMSLKLFSSEEYAKWMQSAPATEFSHEKYAVWHIIDVALTTGGEVPGDGAYIPFPGLTDVWNHCGSLMGPKAHWVVPLGRGMLCDAREGGRALKGIWGCVVEAIANPNNAEVT